MKLAARKAKTPFASTLRSLTRREDGTSLLETAAVLPVLLLLLAVAIDLGRAFRASIALSAAAEAGAMYGIHHPTDVSGMQTTAMTDSGGWISITPTAQFGCECSDGSSAIPACSAEPSCSANSIYYVQVTTSSTYTPLMPWPGVPSSMQLHANARLRAAR